MAELDDSEIQFNMRNGGGNMEEENGYAGDQENGMENNQANGQNGGDHHGQMDQGRTELDRSPYMELPASSSLSSRYRSQQL